MQNKYEVDFVVLLLFLGIFFIIKSIAEETISDLIFGCILIYYHIRVKYFTIENTE